MLDSFSSIVLPDDWLKVDDVMLRKNWNRYEVFSGLEEAQLIGSS